MLEQRIEKVVDAILNDYRHGRDIDRIQQRRQPDRDVIIDVIEKLRRIVYPGYFHDKNYRIYNAKHNLSMLIEDVMYNLSQQVELVLREEGVDQAREQAQETCLEFLGQIPSVREYVQTFQMSQLLASGGQNIGVSVSASILPMNIQD